MTLLKISNQKLKELNTVSEKIEKLILSENWPEPKTKQAIKIVQDLFVTG